MNKNIEKKRIVQIIPAENFAAKYEGIEILQPICCFALIEVETHDPYLPRYEYVAPMVFEAGEGLIDATETSNLSDIIRFKF